MLTITKTQSPSSANATAKHSSVKPWMWTAIACIAISGVAYFFIVSPKWKLVGIGREIDIAAAQEQTAGRERYLSQLQTLQKNYQAIDQSSIDLLSRMLPLEKSTPELLHQLEAIARQSGVALTDVNISEVQPDTKRTTAAQRAAAQQNTGVKQLLLQLQVTAYDYPTFRSFLEGLQSHTRLLDVQSYLFTTEKPVQQLTLKAYYIE